MTSCLFVFLPGVEAAVSLIKIPAHKRCVAGASKLRSRQTLSSATTIATTSTCPHNLPLGSSERGQRSRGLASCPLPPHVLVHANPKGLSLQAATICAVDNVIEVRPADRPRSGGGGGRGGKGGGCRWSHLREEAPLATRCSSHRPLVCAGCLREDGCGKKRVAKAQWRTVRRRKTRQRHRQ